MTAPLSEGQSGSGCVPMWGWGCAMEEGTAWRRALGHLQLCWGRAAPWMGGTVGTWGRARQVGGVTCAVTGAVPVCWDPTCRIGEGA